MALSIRWLSENDWQEFRAVRLAALQEAPAAFGASYAEESRREEPQWRAEMMRAHRVLAERGGAVVGTVSLGEVADDPEAADVFALWVAPEARNTGVSWRLVEAAAQRATEEGRSRLYYWVSTENGRAIAFAANFGFRPTGQRRAAQVADEEFGDQEVALVLSLGSDPGVPNPTVPRLRSRPGPAG
jgi:RimJ/RimL family protein N-acetyltransferase